MRACIREKVSIDQYSVKKAASAKEGMLGILRELPKSPVAMQHKVVIVMLLFSLSRSLDSGSFPRSPSYPPQTPQLALSHFGFS